MRTLLLVAPLLLCASLAWPATTGYGVPRRSQRNGLSDATGLPITWSEKQNIV
jgi:hypothetical protein